MDARKNKEQMSDDIVKTIFVISIIVVWAIACWWIVTV